MKLLKISLLLIIILIVCNIQGMMYGGRGSIIWDLTFVFSLFLLFINYIYCFYKILRKFDKLILISIILSSLFLFYLFISPTLFGPIVQGSR